MTAPEIDVLFPVRQARTSLPEALGDILAQREVTLRVLAVVDLGPAGEDDGSRAWLEARAREEPRLIVLPGEGRGAAAALQLALEQVRAPLLSHMEADDRCPPERLARLHAALTPQLDGVTSRVEFLGEPSPGMQRYLAWQNSLLSGARMAAERFLEIPALHQTGLYRSEVVRAVGGYVPRGPWPVDIDFWFRWFAHERAVTKLAEPLYAWRQHSEQSTRSGGAHGRASLRAAKLHALAEHLRARDGGPPPLHLLAHGRALKRWRKALTDAGLAPDTQHEWHPLESARAPSLPTEGVLLAVYGMADQRAAARAALGALPEPQRLIFTG
ncbi:MAG: hypothetical protein DHS20C15_12980 [Planctomycetota bacterium]|nr:MAG: hypothetical protein DHS20C15_12980 [Planctomycetota bacterium]